MQHKTPNIFHRSDIKKVCIWFKSSYFTAYLRKRNSSFSWRAIAISLQRFQSAVRRNSLTRHPFSTKNATWMPGQIWIGPGYTFRCYQYNLGLQYDNFSIAFLTITQSLILLSPLIAWPSHIRADTKVLANIILPSGSRQAIAKYLCIHVLLWNSWIHTALGSIIVVGLKESFGPTRSYEATGRNRRRRIELWKSGSWDVEKFIIENLKFIYDFERARNCLVGNRKRREQVSQCVATCNIWSPLN